MVHDLLHDRFEKEINASRPVMVIFWESWCSLCRALLPIVDEIAEEVGQEYKFFKVDVEKNAALASYYRIKNVPTVYVFKNGRALELSVGVQTKEALLKMLERNKENVSENGVNRGIYQ